MDSFKKFSEDKLPDRYNFFSSLKDQCITEKDYIKLVVHILRERRQNIPFYFNCVSVVYILKSKDKIKKE